MALGKKTKSTKKRVYHTDPLEKIKNGKPWTLHFEVDPDVAAKLVEEKINNPFGAEFGKLINENLRKVYGIKKKKLPTKRSKAQAA